MNVFGGARFTLENDSMLAYEKHFQRLALDAVQFASCRETVDELDINIKLKLRDFIIVSDEMTSPPILNGNIPKYWGEFSDIHGI